MTTEGRGQDAAGTGTGAGTQAGDPLWPLARDLARVAGTLEEIATAWRRADLMEPGLPLAMPALLAATARRLAAAVTVLSLGGQPRDPGLGRAVAGQLPALAAGITAAMAVTGAAGQRRAGDGPLWERLRPALCRAARQARALDPGPGPGRPGG
jgi:hypothetical protein